MKKSILLVAMLSLMATSFSQDNIFNIKYKWLKLAGYSYQPGYKYGFSLAGGSLLSIGLAEDGARFDVATNPTTGQVTEFREPTWSMRCGWIGYTFDQNNTGWGAISIRPMLVMGFNKTKDSHFDVATNSWVQESETYFTMAPTLAVNLWFVHFSVGYEFVPKFTEINGLNFGVGFSIPFSSKSVNERLERMSGQNKNKTNTKK